jgi:hypothetical protein
MANARRSSVSVLVVSLGVLASFRPIASFAAEGCKAVIDKKTSVIVVSAKNVGANPLWGTAAGAETATFFNAGTCFAKAKLNKCTLGDPATLSGRTPPAGCRVCVDDAIAPSCCVLVAGCIPGIRLRDDSFPSADPRFETIEALAAGPTLRFTGVNVQVVDGSGDTGGTTNGRGNLIVGYNEDNAPPNDRSGSHNLVIGPRHTFSSYGGLVAGYRSTVSGPSASVTGGYGNAATNRYASVSGGYYNTASGSSASVSGGGYNTASGGAAFVSGGVGNTASGNLASVSGGGGNTASGNSASVSGGLNNTASGTDASVSGGRQNTANGNYASVSGGRQNTASSDDASVSGGRQNTANGTYASVSGGRSNFASYYGASVSGGYGNNANNSSASVSGGKYNTASGSYASVSGGYGGTASAYAASVSGGYGNTASAYAASVSGGNSNTASGPQASVSGGVSITAGASNEWHAGQTAGFPSGTVY